MIGACCTDARRGRRLARRISGAAASLLPGAVLMTLPKCPLCLAAWLTATTGADIPVAAAAGVRVAVWIAAVVGIAAAATLSALRPQSSTAPRSLWPFRAAGCARRRCR